MGIQDKQGEFSNAQAITVTAKSTETLYQGPRPGPGVSANGSDEEVPIEFTVTETFTADGAATLTVGIRSSEASNMGSPTTHMSSAAIPKAALVAGANLDAYLGNLRVPRSSGPYVDVYYTVATGPMTAGKITARVQAGRQASY